VNRKHITQQMIKEFTPLLGYISWSSFQWIFCIICSKCSNMCFTMIKMPNRWLQWLQNVQKPLARLFRHLVWPKIEEDRLLGSSPSNLLSMDHQNAPFPPQPSPHAPKCGKTHHWVQLLIRIYVGTQ
jgi:hypothetical protein